MSKSKLEKWLDMHNHEMELIRTVGSIIGAIGGVAGIFVFLKIFGFI